MPEYVIKKGGKRVHIRSKVSATTLCGIKQTRDFEMRYPTKDDESMPVCSKCHQIMISIVNA